MTEAKRLAATHSYHFLKDDTTLNMGVDGTTPVNYDYVPPESQSYRRLLIGAYVAIKEDSDGFLSLPALTNGLLFQVLDLDSNIVQHFGTDELPIKAHWQFVLWAGNDVVEGDGTNFVSLKVRWTLGHSGADLWLPAGYTFRCVVQDNLSTITELYMMLQGHTDGNIESRSR